MAKQKKAKEPYSSKTRVELYPSKRLRLPFAIAKLVLRCKGVRVVYTDLTEGNLETPAVVLCNHGSLPDFVYAGSILRKFAPNFIVARLYFYGKPLGKLIRRFGCFPKSMFTADPESAVNSLRVIKGGGLLAMMPEARLSTAGRFEDIQPGTYPFLKKVKAPIYTVKMGGDYLADPKWGRGFRRGSLVEAELSLLMSAEEVKAATVEEIAHTVESKLYYDEFTWLKDHPEVRYKDRRMAEGLENILTTCPACGKKFTLYAKKRKIFCEGCGEVAALDDRYGFVGEKPYVNHSVWYETQKDILKQEILADEGYTLTSPVELKLPSVNGKSMLRSAGRGVCSLNREGLIYRGTVDGAETELTFPIGEIYRLLFGAGEDFEVYVGETIHYFIPDERRSCVEWYMASAILYDLWAEEIAKAAKEAEEPKEASV